MERLKRRSEFRAVATGLRASGSAFVLQARRREDDGPPRVGFTVSKQVGNAVERNRVRRRLREIVRLSAAGQAAASPLRAGHDYVLVGRRAALTAPFEDLVGELDAALGRIHRGERGGAGSARKRSLHQTGSPSQPPPRQGRRNPPDSPLETPARPTADPPREI